MLDNDNMAGFSDMNDGVRGTWVQTERKAHEEWAVLIGKHQKAAQLLHLLVANMDKSGAVVISQKVMAELMSVHYNTIKKAVKILKENNWIDVVRIGSERGGVNAYVVNRRVAWADKRENQRYAAFDARIVTSSDEQDRETIENKEPLKQLPNMGEFQMPHGDGIEPPSQTIIDGLEPQLPAINNTDRHTQKTLDI
jgi:DNA-binding transcriptional regulator YhcF (GntR family)